MNDLKELLETLLSWLLLPATVYGAGGAFMRAGRTGKSIRQTVFAIVGGIITTNALSPLIDAYSPQPAHKTLYFLAGYGGLALVDRLYRLAAGIAERRIASKFGGGSHVDDEQGE
ncbi:MAG: hypothetical protein LBP61_08235 [Desulfovibrio sp.]|jgi:hypothetical protein|nr:hypothetical protein [Desulfovibrio sp.]